MELTISEFERMVECYYEMHDMEVWEQGYWVANIMNTNLTKPISVKKLVKPLLSAKPKQSRAEEAAAFFAAFKKQRKESEKLGNS